MEKIIDLHGHPGDYFYPGGPRVIGQKGIKTPLHFNIIRLPGFSETIRSSMAKRMLYDNAAALFETAVMRFVHSVASMGGAVSVPLVVIVLTNSRFSD